MRAVAPLAVVLLSALAAWLLWSRGSAQTADDVSFGDASAMTQRARPMGASPAKDLLASGGVIILPDISTAVTGTLTGWATFYDVAAGHAAAGPVLRRALGGDPAFRGRSVRVCAAERCLVTRLSDWCACGPRADRPTLIDLARSDFARLSPPSRGVVLVSITALPFLPPTSTED